MSIKNSLLKINFILNQLGINLIQLINSLRSLPNFFYDFVKFKKSYRGKLNFLPCLHDRYEEAGVTKSEYFWQDLLVARWIKKESPIKHLDIGSRIDGFVAHVSSFRNVEVIDIRPVKKDIPGVIFHQADIMNLEFLKNFEGKGGYCDSLSCLHALEHFGLGRYGDPINPQGYQVGLRNMSKLLKANGLLYLSTPIGVERVEFNANWVFDPRTINRIALENGLKIKSLTIFNHNDGIYEISPNEDNLSNLAKDNYNLGIFTFMKS